MTSIFLSYARHDDETFVKRLYADLIGAGFDVWFDRVSMPSRSLTFHQEIRDAIANRDRLLLVVGPKAVASDYVTQEWQFAHFAANKCVNPIIRLDGLNPDGSRLNGYALMPEDLKPLHTEDFRDDDRYAEHLDNLIRQLKEDLPPVGKLVAVPELPPGYRAHPDRLKVLRDLLLNDLHKPVVVTGAIARVGLQGMGGIGKSVLASALAHHPQVQRAFQDGIFWVRLGQRARIEDLQRRLATELGGDGLFNDWQNGKEELRRLLAERAALLILDDVWERTHVDAFNVVGARGRILLTTRDTGLMTAFAARENHYRVELPTLSEAKAILAGAADIAPEDLPTEASEIIRQCGRLPLALALCGGMVQGGSSWSNVLAALRDHDLEFLSSEYPDEEHHQSAWKAMDVSVRVLPLEEQDRFTELAAFAADTGAPDAAVAMLWRQTGGLARRNAEALLAKFIRRSLVERQAAEGHAAVNTNLHDLLRHFVTGMAIKRFGTIAAAHERLLTAYGAQCTDGKASGPDDGYFFQKLAHHLLLAGRTKELVALLFDFRWLKAKIGSTAPHSLQQDFGLLLQANDTHLTKEDRALLAQLRNVVGPLRSPELLPTTLWGHFGDTAHPQVRNLLEQARSLTLQPWLRPITPCLASANATLIQSITDTGLIESLAIGDTVDGDPIVAAITHSSPRFVRIWIAGIAIQVVPLSYFDEKRLLPDNMPITAMNLPGDSRPAILLSWTDVSHGNCCSLFDLSKATFDVSDRIAESLSQLAVGHRDPFALGPVMVLGDRLPISVGNIAGRLVLLSYQSAGSDYHARHNAETLAALMHEKVTVFPKRGRLARAVIYDVETGDMVPRISWPLRGTSRPILVGEDDEGRPFLVHTHEDGMGVALHKFRAKRSIPLGHTSYLGDRLALSHRCGRPVIVKGGSGIEVMDASTCKVVGRFSKHLDNERLLAAGMGEDGTPLVASVGELGTRGRFSTSVRIWDVETQTQISPTGTAHTGGIGAITSGRYQGVPVFATGGGDLISIWSTRVVPGYSVELEPREIADPNICGRAPLDQLPRGHRHHDLGATAPLGSPFIEALGVQTWSAGRTDFEAANSTYQRWRLGPPGDDGRRQGVPISANPAISPDEDVATPLSNSKSGYDVISVSMSGGWNRYCAIETTRRDGTRRGWRFSPRADWERQCSDWHYWHCVSIEGTLAKVIRIEIRVNPLSGDVVIDYEDGSSWKRLKYDPGCPATQCALGEDGQSLVIFDERGTAHHLELVIPPNRTRRP